VVCLDDVSFALCQQDKSYTCTRARFYARASDFMQNDFGAITFYLKYSIIYDVLRMQRTIFLFDDDVMLFQFPVSRDLNRTVSWWYQAEACTHGLNSGVMVARPTPKTLEIAKFMRDTKNHTFLDQVVLAEKLNEYGVSHKVLPPTYTGKCCEDGCRPDHNNTRITFHAHCAGEVPSKLECLMNVS